MLDCFKLKGRMKQICSGLDNNGLPIDLDPHKRIEYLKMFFSDLSEEEIAQHVAAQGSSIPQTIDGKIIIGGATVKEHRLNFFNKKNEPVGTFLKTRIKDLIRVSPTSGCGCSNLAAEMDKNGIDWCISNKDIIVAKLVSNKSMLIESLKASGENSIIDKISGKAIELLPDILLNPILRFGANFLLDLAINDAKNHSVKTRDNIVIRTTPKIVMPLTSIQKRLYRDSIGKTPSKKDPFINQPIVHFGAHLWPVKTFWKKHADKWNELSENINGKCVVGIVTDSSTDSFEDVKKYFSSRFELFEMPNTPDGENPTFRELIKIIPNGNDDVLIYCHGKGVRSHTNSSESVRTWTEHMYETVVFNYEKALEKLSEGYKCFGSYRTFGDIPLSPRYRWHYSGTFFIVRSKYMKNTIVKSGYGGVECWPGDNIDISHSYCEFLENQAFKTGYDINELYPRIIDMQMDWEVNRLDGPRCEQHKRELEWFYKYINKNDRILVIGSKHGGLEYQIKQSFPYVNIVSCDISPQEDNKEFVIIGNSSDENIKNQIKEYGPYDLVFIDGDHSYSGVKSDLEFAIDLNPRIIAFHDIAKTIKHKSEGCEVDILWNEVKARYKTDEKIVGCGWGGIGVIKLK